MGHKRLEYLQLSDGHSHHICAFGLLHFCDAQKLHKTQHHNYLHGMTEKSKYTSLCVPYNPV